MAGRKGNLQHPQFETLSGVTLKLAAINQSAMQMYLSQWRKKNPPPQAPVITLSNGETWRDVTDELFKQIYASWNQDYGTASMNFVFKHGILSQPPKNFESPFEEIDISEPIECKKLWLAMILSDSEPNEYESLMTAIMGLNRPTVQGVEEAEKN